MIFNNLLNNGGLRIRLLGSLRVESGSSSIENLFLLIAKHVVFRGELPVVFSVLLFTWCKISVSFSIESM